MRRYLQETDGASAAEYALILTLVGAAIAVSALVLGDAVSGSMNNASSTIASVASGSTPAPGGGSTTGPTGPSHGKNPNAGAGNNSGIGDGVGGGQDHKL